MNAKEQKRGIRVLYENALSRLSPEEREKERRKEGGIPYPLSLIALAGHFYKAGTEQGWMRADGRMPSALVVAAVSGGGDSVALLWFLRMFCTGPVLCAHFNHGIRGRAAEQDEAFVRALARDWNLEFLAGRAEVPSAMAPGESLEMAARRLRHDFLERTALERGAWGVALGHNREDLAETVFFNLLRGTGVRGSVGIPPRRGLFFRPLLGLERDFLRAILDSRKLKWQEDATNADICYTRNFLRESLFPLMKEKINARLVDHLVAFAEDMRYYREEEERLGKELLFRLGCDAALLPLTVERSQFLPLSEQEIVIFIRALGRALKLPTLSRIAALDLSRKIAEGGTFVFPWGGGVRVQGSAKRVCWTRES
ncbi:MAG: tRNA lysidine(34) synthetase TilS [Fretibacterium sp.]|nr:tRNA lysidine(34) synthetase TilS [Fretibacterium sp.]